MPRRRPLAPATSAYANAPLVQDPEVRRAIDPLVRDLQQLQKGARAVLEDGSRAFALGDDATGDIWYRDKDGIVRRLPLGNEGDVLTVVGGLPRWAPP